MYDIVYGFQMGWIKLMALWKDDPEFMQDLGSHPMDMPFTQQHQKKYPRQHYEKAIG